MVMANFNPNLPKYTQSLSVPAAKAMANVYRSKRKQGPKSTTQALSAPAARHS